MKGLNASLTERFEEISGTGQSGSIKDIDELIAINVRFLGMIEKLIFLDIENDYPQIRRSKEILTEVIENLYTALRTLKRANKKSTVATSQMARDLSATSKNFFEKSLYGH